MLPIGELNISSSKSQYWNWLSIILLGLILNFIINAVFDYKYQRLPVSFSLVEYLNAIFISFILLGGTRAISNKILVQNEVVNSFSHFGVFLLYNTIYIALILNLLLLIGAYFVFGMYTYDEILVINIAAIFLTLLFVVIDLGLTTFSQRNFEMAVSRRSKDSTEYIIITSGKRSHQIELANISYAYSDDGNVFIVTVSGNQHICNYSLDVLMSKVNPEYFIRANRKFILNRNVICSIESLEYGKLKVIASSAPNDQLSSITVSRIKASSFREWFYNQNNR